MLHKIYSITWVKMIRIASANIIQLLTYFTWKILHWQQKYEISKFYFVTIFGLSILFSFCKIAITITANICFLLDIIISFVLLLDFFFLIRNYKPLLSFEECEICKHTERPTLDKIKWEQTKIDAKKWEKNWNIQQHNNMNVRCKEYI